MLTYQIHHWPASVGEEAWSLLGEPVEASSVIEAFEKVNPTIAGRYCVTVNGSSTRAFYRLEADATLIPVDTF